MTKLLGATGAFLRSDLFRNFAGGFVAGAAGLIGFAAQAGVALPFTA